jgi:hypothetical protein
VPEFGDTARKVIASIAVLAATAIVTGSIAVAKKAEAAPTRAEVTYLIQRESPYTRDRDVLMLRLSELLRTSRRLEGKVDRLETKVDRLDATRR